MYTGFLRNRIIFWASVAKDPKLMLALETITYDDAIFCEHLAARAWGLRVLGFESKRFRP